MDNVDGVHRCQECFILDVDLGFPRDIWKIIFLREGMNVEMKYGSTCFYKCIQAFFKAYKERHHGESDGSSGEGDEHYEPKDMDVDAVEEKDSSIPVSEAEIERVLNKVLKMYPLIVVIYENTLLFGDMFHNVTGNHHSSEDIDKKIYEILKEIEPHHGAKIQVLIKDLVWEKEHMELYRRTCKINKQMKQLTPVNK